jgi:hypothetical protein
MVRDHISPRTPRISGKKISGLETNIFELKMMVKSLLFNLPGQFSLSGQIVLHRAAATLIGLL